MDMWLNPLRFHENLIYELKQRIQPRTKPKKEDIYTCILEDLCHWDILMCNNVCEPALQLIAASVTRLDKLALKKTAAPSQTEFTKLINMLSVRKKAINSLYESTDDRKKFPWHKVGSYEKSFLCRK